MAAKPRVAKAAPRQHSTVWLQGLACGAVATLAPGFALLLALLLAPGLVTLLFDREPGRPVARSVLLSGLAASMPPLRALWAAGQSLAAALALMGDVEAVGTAWSAAAAGWLLAELTPLAGRLVLETLARARVARLRAERERLVETWRLDGVQE